VFTDSQLHVPRNKSGDIERFVACCCCCGWLAVRTVAAIEQDRLFDYCVALYRLLAKMQVV
jgi:hypothetical protein